MKTKFIPCLVTLFFAVLMTVPASAQQSAAQCVANIQKRLDDLGQQADFDILKAREIMEDFDFGKVTDAVGSADKAVAFKRVFTSLSEFCDAAGNNLSAKGMKGYTKLRALRYSAWVKGEGSTSLRSPAIQ